MIFAVTHIKSLLVANFIQTNSSTFELFDTNQEMNIDEIFWSLSGINRYLGHQDSFYSVAQHCVLGANYIRDVLKLNRYEQYKFLMHDWCEAYIGDMPYPVKRQIPQFRDFEEKVWATHAHKLNLPVDMNSEEMNLVHEIDRRICKDEFRVLFKEGLDNKTIDLMSSLKPLGIDFMPLSRYESYRLITKSFKEITCD